MINLGSGAFLLRGVGAEPRRVEGLLTTLVESRAEPWPGCGTEARYALEGTVNAAGTAIDWAERRLGLRVPIASIDRFLGPGDDHPRRVHFLPAVSGLGAPHWDSSARPGFHGDLRGATRRDLLRSVIESIACRCVEIARRAGPERGPILVSGGLTLCGTLLQAQADLIGRTLRVRESPDATAEGAALMAADGGQGALAAAIRPLSGGTRSLGNAEGSRERLVRPRIGGDQAEARFRAWKRAVYSPGDGPGATGAGAAAGGASRAARTARS